MSINEALDIFSKSGRNKNIVKYSVLPNGILLIAEDLFDYSNCYYFVSDNGKIEATNPILVKLYKYEIIDL